MFFVYVRTTTITITTTIIIKRINYGRTDEEERQGVSQSYNRERGNVVLTAGKLRPIALCMYGS